MPRKQNGMSDADWYRVLTEGEADARAFRRMIRKVPSNPRCKLCYVPFGGVGGRFNRLRGNGPSRKNPSFCRGCFESAPVGGAEADIGILFADVRGFTTMSEAQGPRATATLMNRFYEMATNVLTEHDAVIDKLVGDEVMALFIPGFAGKDYMEKMVIAADDLLRGVGYGSERAPWLAAGIGLDAGVCYVGNVGSGEVKDFTALGDPVNTAARLQSQARPGQILMSDRVYEASGGRYPSAEEVTLDLKGKKEQVRARVVTLTSNIIR
jgi:adenylate cyclase